MIITSKKLIDLKKDLTDVSKKPISEDGNFGIVYKGIFHKRRHGHDEQLECAIKRLKAKELTNKDLQNIHREIQSQYSLKYPSILELYGFYIPFCEVGKCTIVTPYMRNGSLHRILQKEARHQAPHDWTNTTRAINIFGIAAGMCYMHQKKVLHRDLKTDNILVDDDFYPKICDFGCSKIIKDGLDEIIQSTNCGTPVYMAPELILGEDYNSKIDVFAYAMILYELFALYPAYEDPHSPHKFAYLQNIVDGKRPKLDGRFPDFFKELITKCWAQNPEERPSFVEIVKSMLTAYRNNEIFKAGDIEREFFDDYAKEALKSLDLDEIPDLDF